MLQKRKKEINPDNSNNGISKSKTVKIIGFGNIFMGDDGIGIRVIDELEKVKFFKDSENMEIINGATSGIDLLFTLGNFDRAIINFYL